jgi:hypothetical protein
MSAQDHDIFHDLASGFLPTDLEKGGLKEESIIRRLDGVIGLAGWRPEYSGAGQNTVVCRLTITLADGASIAKSGCGRDHFGGNCGQPDGMPAHVHAFRAAAALLGIRPVLLSASRALETPAPRDLGWVHGSDDRRPETNGHANANGHANGHSNGQAATAEKPKTEWPNKCPQNGRQLFGRLKDLEKENRDGLKNYITGWGKRQGYGGTIVDWDSAQCAAAWAETTRKIREVEGQ